MKSLVFCIICGIPLAEDDSNIDFIQPRANPNIIVIRLAFHPQGFRDMPCLPTKLHGEFLSSVPSSGSGVCRDAGDAGIGGRCCLLFTKFPAYTTARNNPSSSFALSRNGHHLQYSQSRSTEGLVHSCWKQQLLTATSVMKRPYTSSPSQYQAQQLHILAQPPM